MNRLPTERFEVRQQVAWVLIATLLVLLAVQTGASAGHGSWNHHHLHWFESGSSSYGSYADVGATDRYDYGHAQWQRWTSDYETLLEAHSVTCDGGNEGCPYRKTYTQYFPQSSYGLRSLACAKDGAHKLSGTGGVYSPCSGKVLDTHRHRVKLS